MKHPLALTQPSDMDQLTRNQQARKTSKNRHPPIHPQIMQFRHNKQRKSPRQATPQKRIRRNSASAVLLKRIHEVIQAGLEDGKEAYAD